MSKSITNFIHMIKTIENCKAL